MHALAAGVEGQGEDQQAQALGGLQHAAGPRHLQPRQPCALQPACQPSTVPFQAPHQKGASATHSLDTRRRTSVGAVSTLSSLEKADMACGPCAASASPEPSGAQLKFSGGRAPCRRRGAWSRPGELPGGMQLPTCASPSC